MKNCQCASLSVCSALRLIHLLSRDRRMNQILELCINERGQFFQVKWRDYTRKRSTGTDSSGLRNARILRRNLQL